MGEFPSRHVKQTNQIDSLSESKIDAKKERSKLSEEVLSGLLGDDTLRTKKDVEKRLNTNDYSKNYLKLKEFGYGLREIEDIMMIEGPIEKRVEYFMKLSELTGLKNRNLSNGGVFEIQWYLVESDIKKVEKYMKALKEAGLYGKAYGYKLYEAGASGDFLERNKKSFKILTDRGRLISEVRKKIPNKAKYKNFAESLREYGVDQNLTFSEAYYVINTTPMASDDSEYGVVEDFAEFLVEARTVNFKKAAILWVSSGGNPSESMIRVLRRDKYKASILNGDPERAMDIATKLREKGITDQGTMRKLWKYADNIDDAMFLHEFEKKYKFGLLDKDLSGKIGKTVQTLRRIDELCSKSSEAIEFCKHIFKNTRKIKTENIESFLSDPALPISIIVYQVMQSPRMKGPKDIETALIIGRNIYFEYRNDLAYFYQRFTKNYGRFILPGLIDDHQARLEDLKEKHKDVYVFKEKAVLFLGNSERWGKKNEKRFTPPKILKAIAKSIGGENPEAKLKVVEPESEDPSEQNLIDVKHNVLSWIKNTNEPITFVFSGHGGEDKLYLCNNDSPNAYITVRDMADALIERSKKMGSQITAKDVLAINSCFSNNFIRNVYEIIQDEHPMRGLTAITEAEYGQYGFTNSNEKKDSLFKVLGLGEEDIKIKDVMKREKKFRGSDASIFVYDRGRPNQISQKEAEKNKKKA